MSELRLATRASGLALAQTRIVADALARHGVSSVPVEVETSGDVDRVSPVATLTEVGAFVRSVQMAVLEGRADVAVHSGKDLPVTGPPGLESYHPPRAVPWDVLSGGPLSRLPSGARVGTGSPRRAAQLRRLRADLEVTDIRGNVETRLAKAGDGTVDAVVLAEAGLVRLGLEDRIGHRFEPEEMVPAPAQGALTLECSTGSAAAEALSEIDDPDTRRALDVERGLLAATGAGCRSALGCLAVVAADGTLDVYAFVEDDRGPRRTRVRASEPPEAIRAVRRELAV